MKAPLLFVLLATGSIAAGCAPAPMTKAEVDGRVVCNVDRMAEVERVARHENRELHWVHCPSAVLRAV